jgi:hypothetical protein
MLISRVPFSFTSTTRAPGAHTTTPSPLFIPARESIFSSSLDFIPPPRPMMIKHTLEPRTFVRAQRALYLAVRTRQPG